MWNYWENVEAIDRYIKGATLNTPAATAIRDDWTKFYNEFSWSYASQEDYDRARNLRNRFNLANAITKAQKEQVEHVMKTGLTTEELAGGTSRKLSSGMYEERLFSEETRTALILGGIAAVGLFVLYQTGKIARAFY